MTPEKIKEYTELLEKYIKESEGLPFSAVGIILSLHATTELLELLKNIRYTNLYQNDLALNVICSGEYDTIEFAQETLSKVELKHI